MNKPPRHILKVSSTNSCAKRLLEKVLTCLASREEFGEDVLAEAVQLPECSTRPHSALEEKNGVSRAVCVGCRWRTRGNCCETESKASKASKARTRARASEL